MYHRLPTYGEVSQWSSGRNEDGYRERYKSLSDSHFEDDEPKVVKNNTDDKIEYK